MKINKLTKKVTIIIPTYNEKENIKKLLGQIVTALPYAKILVVDDSPNDQTAKLVKLASKKHSSIKILSRKGKGGRGSAVLAGMEYAIKKFKSEVYVEMDADLSHSVEELTTIVSAVNPKTVAIASRYLKESKIIGWPIERRVASKISNFLIRTILGIPLHDNTNGYRGYSKQAVKQILSKKFISHGYIVLSETAYFLKNKHYSFVEIPSVFHNRRRGRSNANLQEFIGAFRDLIRIRYKI